MNAIYQPKGKAAEYAEWACNFYVGCSNNCSYCFLKKGRGAKILGGCTPTLKKCFKNEEHALEVFKKEVIQNISELQEKGLFFSFTTEPMLSETINLTGKALSFCLKYDIPVKILSKIGDFEMVYFPFIRQYIKGVWIDNSKIAFGFTLTGHDELEPNASTNQERIEAIKKLHNIGFKTWVSLEPIIDFASSLDMFNQTIDYCDHYKIGLLKRAKYPIDELEEFIRLICLKTNGRNTTIYFKDSITSKLDELNECIAYAQCIVSQNFKF